MRRAILRWIQRQLIEPSTGFHWLYLTQTMHSSSGGIVKQRSNSPYLLIRWSPCHASPYHQRLNNGGGNLNQVRRIAVKIKTLVQMYRPGSPIRLASTFMLSGNWSDPSPVLRIELRPAPCWLQSGRWLIDCSDDRLLKVCPSVESSRQPSVLTPTKASKKLRLYWMCVEARRAI